MPATCQRPRAGRVEAAQRGVRAGIRAAAQRRAPPPALPAGGRDRDPVARHADLETASIPTELDFGKYRHAQEVTDSMSIETVDTCARAAAAVALVRHRASETRFLPIAARPVPDHPGYFQVNRVDRTGSALSGGWTYLVDLTKRTVVRTSGDPDRLDVAAALRRGTRA